MVSREYMHFCTWVMSHHLTESQAISLVFCNATQFLFIVHESPCAQVFSDADVCVGGVICAGISLN